MAVLALIASIAFSVSAIPMASLSLLGSSFLNSPYHFPDLGNAKVDIVLGYLPSLCPSYSVLPYLKIGGLAL